MSTRSRITQALPNGTFKSIYCHFDGYLSGVGKILLEDYNTEEKLAALLDLGDISSIDPRFAKVEAYGRDRGEKGTEALIVPDMSQIDRQSYNYLFTPEGEWMYMKAGERDWKIFTLEDCKED
jgi:hypothetical protein